MKNVLNLEKQRFLLPLLGFVFLFLVYHIPELLQDNFQKHSILILELGMLLFTILAFFVGKQKFRNGFKTFGLVDFRKYWSNLTKGLFLGIFIATLANLIPFWLKWNEIAIQFKWHQIILQTLLFAVGTLFPSLAEDILTRAYLKAFWPEKWNVKWLVFFSASVYVFNHIFRLNKPDVLVYLFVLGLLLMWSLTATGTLWLTLGIHWGVNIAFQFFTNIVDMKSLKETGFENYVMAACCGFCFMLVYLLHKGRSFIETQVSPGRI